MNNIANRFFSLEGSEEYFYCTLCYCFKYRPELRNINVIITDEYNEEIYISNIQYDENVIEDFKEIDSIYTPPEHFMIKRVFDFEFSKYTGKIDI